MTTQIQRTIRKALSDVFTFVRSQEANKSIQAVTFAQLISEQIDRNGDTDRSNAAQYNPYSFEPGALEPATSRPLTRANYLSGTDTNNPTKLDRVLAIQNTLSALVDQVKAMPLDEVTSAEVTDEDGELLTNDPLFLNSEEVFQDLNTETAIA